MRRRSEAGGSVKRAVPILTPSPIRSMLVGGAILALGSTLLVAGSGAQAEPGPTLQVDDARAGSCDRPRDGAGADATTVTAPVSGIVEAAVVGEGDWDLTVLDGADVVAASAGFTGTEVATGFVEAGTELRVQGCLLDGAAETVDLELTFLEVATDDERASLVSVETPTPVQRQLLQKLDLDLTEHGDAESLSVVAHSPADLATLDGAGLAYDVEIADLAAANAADRRADRAYSTATERSELPSGRTEYRRLADYEAELKALAEQYPELVRPLTLSEVTVEGRQVHGIEITANPADVHDGKPVFLHLGLHHAREWPSGEHTMEWAYELLQGYGTDDELTELVETTRTIVVPVVNPDGFTISREAAVTDSFGLFSYDNKRKNCSISTETPAEFAVGTCADNPAGRLRGTDPNRNYGGLWGGSGASPNWSSDIFRGDAPFSEPETQNIRALVAERPVTTLVTNHTFGNLWLRPPGVAATGRPVDEPAYEALGARATSHNGYANVPAYELYETTGATEDWTFWTAGALSFTPEIGDENFHPEFARAVVAEYAGLEPAAGAGAGGNAAAYREIQRATADPELHARVVGQAPTGYSLEFSKVVLTETSPVVGADGNVGEPLRFRDDFVTRYEHDSGRFTVALPPSTRPIVDGRLGREPTGPVQEPIALVNPDGVPEENPLLDFAGPNEATTFTIEGPADGVDNGAVELTFSWGSAEQADWDFFLLDPAGQIVAAAATVNQPETLTLLDPAPGEYTVVAFNYAQADPATPDDWSGTAEFLPPTPPTAGETEAWTMTCLDRDDAVVARRSVVVDRGETINVRNACRPSLG